MPTEDVARALRDAPPRIKPWMYLAAYGGLRACAICQLRVEDVMFDADPPMIFIEVNKGQGMHTVPMSRWLVKALGECNLPPSGWIAPRRDGQAGHLPAWNISHQVNGYLHHIGISHTLHTLRHWAITEFYKASGRDLRATQEFAGHQTPDSTQVYTWVDPGDIASATDRMPDLGF